MVTYDTQTGTAVVRLADELDMASESQILDQVARVAGMDGVLAVVLDLSEVTFIDCAALGAIIAARRLCLSSGVLLSVRDPSPPAARLLRLTGSEHLLLGMALDRGEGRRRCAGHFNWRAEAVPRRTDASPDTRSW